MYLANQNNMIMDVHFYESGMAQYPVYGGSAPAVYTSQCLRHYALIGTMITDSFAALHAIDRRFGAIATML